ncbi:Rrf2 family transcriptional regulator [Anabaena catenula]
MMEISSKVRYALLALLELARYYERGEYLQIEQIANVQQIPDRYLGQLLMILRRSGLVRSQRGAKGGYLLSKPPQQITLLEILTCLDGINTHEKFQKPEFSTMENMIIVGIWEEAAGAAIAVFEGYTLQDMWDKRQQVQQIQPMYHI